MTAEELIQETKESIEFNTKKIELLDKDIAYLKEMNKQRKQKTK